MLIWIVKHVSLLVLFILRKCTYSYLVNLSAFKSIILHKMTQPRSCLHFTTFTAYTCLCELRNANQCVQRSNLEAEFSNKTIIYLVDSTRTSSKRPRKIYCFPIWFWAVLIPHIHMLIGFVFFWPVFSE